MGIKYGTILQNSQTVLLDRIVKIDGTPIIQSDLADINVSVIDMTTRATTYTASPSVASTISNSLVTTGWTADSIGRNSEIILPSTAFPNAPTTYQVVIADTAPIV